MTTSEWGIFNDEGCIEAGFYSQYGADEAALIYRNDEAVTVAKICPDHEEQPADTCEECYSEEEPEDDDA